MNNTPQAVFSFPIASVPLVAVFGLIVVAILARGIFRYKINDPTVLSVTLTIHRGATTFLSREYMVLFPVLALVAVSVSTGDGIVTGL